MNLNKAQLVGRITQDLELKTTPNGQQVLSFSLATNYNYKTKDGEKKEETEFHNIVVWGKQAEVIAQYCQKGQELYIEGRLKTRNWDDKETGKKMYRTEVLLTEFQFGSKAGATGQTQSTGATPQPTTMDTDDIDPDDIPF
jgi:single-strand DNA-binding protein